VGVDITLCDERFFLWFGQQKGKSFFPYDAVNDKGVFSLEIFDRLLGKWSEYSIRSEVERSLNLFHHLSF
jgi:hypothetical protein